MTPMKTLFYSAVFVGFVAVATGAAAKSLPVLDPVGPEAKSAASEGASGGLRVYSGCAATAFGGEDAASFQNTAYEIRSENGQKVQAVPNSYGVRKGDQPPLIQLAPGSYRVIAWSPRQGLVEVPVTIANARTTTVRLDVAAKK